jgi:hypothetical protein
LLPWRVGDGSRFEVKIFKAKINQGADPVRDVVTALC